MPLLSARLTHGDFGLTITDATGNAMQIDIPVDQGGTGKGMRPMQTVLAALAGCSAVDVLSILRKQKQAVAGFAVEVDGERQKDKEPALWETVHVKFIVEGAVDAGKAQRAAELSITKYCSVAETLRRAGAVITFEVEVK